MKEVWKNIKGTNGLYQVSNRARIKSFHHGKVRIIKTGFSGSYPSFIISINGVKKTAFVHRMIGLCFIPNPKNKPEINHKNGIRNDNRISNLEWVTRRENDEHALRTGLIKRWHHKYNARPINKHSKSGRFVKRFKSMAEARDKTGVPSQSIWASANKGILGGGYLWRYD